MSVTLAIECSQRGGGVAIRCSDGVIHATPLESASGVDDQLLPAIAERFESAHVSPEDLSLIGVSVGPGGFTGLRVAVATAKALAVATGCRLVAVPTACVAAASRTGPKRPVGVLLAERRGTAWLTCVSAEGIVEGTPGPVDAASLPDRVGGCEVILGDPHVQAAFGSGIDATGLPIEDLHVTPTACLELALIAASRGEEADVHTLEPIYPRPPEAVRRFDAR
jgi:tRNA threonylcarbamoyladenosine biosynthesis protein TsaB